MQIRSKAEPQSGDTSVSVQSTPSSLSAGHDELHGTKTLGQLKLLLISSGLGNTERGFETSTRRWFQALRQHSSLDVRLFSGGSIEGAENLWTIPRREVAKVAPLLFWMNERSRWEFTYGIEQISFWSALNFRLIDWRPDVVWVKDVPLAHLLLLSRIMFNLDFKIIFANGGTFKPSTYKDFDMVQHLQQSCFDEAARFGLQSDKIELLSNVFPLRYDSLASREQTRQKLGLQADDWAIVSVAAWNRYHKRIDYLIEEVAKIADEKTKLILCGTPEVDTIALQQTAKQLLGDRVLWLTLPEPELLEVLRACDVFVLSSLNECLGNAIVEAVMCGLPVICHKHQAGEFCVGDQYWFEDLSKPDTLANRLRTMRATPPAAEKLAQLRAHVDNRFCVMDQVRQFEDMVLRTVGSRFMDDRA